MPSPDLNTIIITSGATAFLTLITTAIVTVLNHHFNVKKDRLIKADEIERQARHVAVILVCRLDPFARQCDDVVQDDGIPDTGGVYHAEYHAPDFILPEGVEWRALDANLLYRIMNLPNEIDAAKRACAFIADMISGPPEYTEYFDERKMRFGDIGLLAMDITDELRAVYRLPARSADSDAMDLRARLTKGKSDAEAAIKRADERNARALDEIIESASRPLVGAADK